MNDSLLLSIGMFLNIVPYAFLCYFPFKDKIKISIEKLLAILSLPTITEFSFFYFYRPITYSIVQIAFIAFLAIYFFVYLITVRTNISKLIFVFILNTDYAGIIILISHYMEANFSPSWTHFDGYSLNIFSMVAFVITLPLGLALMIKKVRPLLYLENTKAWGSLWVIPLILFFVIISVACVDNNNWILSWQYITLTLTMALGSYVMLYVGSKILIETDENAALRENVRMVNLQLAFQKSAYENLSSRIAETRAARHDLRHHLSVIETYLQSNNYDDLRKYLDEYKSSLPDNKEFLLCENSAANVIVLHYTEIAKEEGIAISTSLYLPQKIKIANMNLCIIFGNCLENALEACRRMENGQKYIRVKSKIHGDMLGITIDNSFDGKVKEKNGIILSRKRDNEEGLGLSSVKAVAAKYNGTALFTFDEKEFQSSIILNIKNRNDCC